MTFWRKLTAAYSGLLSLLLVFSVAILIVPVSLQIFSRYTALIPSYIWTEEMARFLFVWMIMIGAMCAVRDGTHFDLEILPESRNPKVERAKRIFVHLMVSLVAFIFVWYGWQLLLFGWYQTSEIASLPMNWMFVAWPLMGVITLLFMAEKIMIELRRPMGEVA